MCREGEGACENCMYVCVRMCVCVGRQGQRGEGLEGSQMEIAGARERAAIVWPSSASLYLMSVYQEVQHGGRGQWVYLPVPLPKMHPQHTLAEAFTDKDQRTASPSQKKSSN